MRAILVWIAPLLFAASLNASTKSSDDEKAVAILDTGYQAAVSQ